MCRSEEHSGDRHLQADDARLREGRESRGGRHDASRDDSGPLTSRTLPAEVNAHTDMWRWQSSRTAVVGIAIAVFVVCCVLPVAYLLAVSLSGLDASLSPPARCATAPAAVQHGPPRPGYRAPRHGNRRAAGSRARAYLPAVVRPFFASRSQRRSCFRRTSLDWPGCISGAAGWSSALSGRDFSRVDLQPAGGHSRVEPGVLSRVDARDRGGDAPNRRAPRRSGAHGRATASRATTHHASARGTRRIRGGADDLRARGLGIRRPRIAAGPRVHDRGVHGIRGALRLQPRRSCWRCRFCCCASSLRLSPPRCSATGSWRTRRSAGTRPVLFDRVAPIGHSGRDSHPLRCPRAPACDPRSARRSALARWSRCSLAPVVPL